MKDEVKLCTMDVFEEPILYIFRKNCFVFVEWHLWGTIAAYIAGETGATLPYVSVHGWLGFCIKKGVQCEDHKNLRISRTISEERCYPLRTGNIIIFCLLGYLFVLLLFPSVLQSAPLVWRYLMKEQKEESKK